MTLGDALGPGGKQTDLTGVRGWLLFLCITLMVLDPIGAALLSWSLWLAVQQRPNLVVGAIVAAVAIIPWNCLGLIAGVFLYRERPAGVRLAKICFGGRLLLGLLIALVSPLTGLAFAGPSFAWLVYLYRSERVRATYSRAPARSKVAEVFR